MGTRIIGQCHILEEQEGLARCRDDPPKKKYVVAARGEVGPLYRDCGGKAGQNSDPRREQQFLRYSVLLLNFFWRLIFTCIPTVHRAPNLDNRPEKVRN